MFHGYHLYISKFPVDESWCVCLRESSCHCGCLKFLSGSLSCGSSSFVPTSCDSCFAELRIASRFVFFSNICSTFFRFVLEMMSSTDFDMNGQHYLEHRQIGENGSCVSQFAIRGTIDHFPTLCHLCRRLSA